MTPYIQNMMQEIEDIAMKRTSAIITAFLACSSCTPIEREVSEEIIEEVIHECGATAPPYERKEECLTWRAEKHDDTNPATSYKNHRQYPPRRYKNDNSHKPSRGM